MKKIIGKIFYKIIRYKNWNFRILLQICYRLVQNQIIKTLNYKIM